MLKGTVVGVADLNGEDTGAMFGLMSQYYDNLKWENFTSDLRAKDSVILLRDDRGVIGGFSTTVVHDLRVLGRDVKLLFSGDTIIRKEHWSANDLIPVWIRHALSRAEAFDGDLHWLLMTKGYRTYKYLSTFYREFYPRAGAVTPGFEQALLDGFGAAFYPGSYDPKKGVIVMDGKKDYLKQEVADIPENQLNDRNVSFFLERNPGYRSGDELVCTTRLSIENLNGAGRRILGI